MPPLHPPPPARLLLYLLALVILVTTSHLRLNTSPSAPEGLYWLSQSPATPGQWAVACLPEPLARAGRGRGYLPAGECPGGGRPVLKRIVAVAGDQVTVAEDGVSVNGRAVPRTSPSPVDTRGRAVPSVPPGRYPVEPGTVWLLANAHPSSWDSRYFGPVPAAGIQGRAVPLWTWGGSVEEDRDAR